MALKDIADASTKKEANLRGFLQENSKYVTLSTGVPFIGTCKGYKAGVDPRNPERQVVTFTFTVNGKDKTMTTGSVRLVRQMAEIEEDKGFPSTVEIVRTGEKFETNYTVKVVE